MDSTSWLALLAFPAIALVLAVLIVWWTLPRRSPPQREDPSAERGDDTTSR